MRINTTNSSTQHEKSVINTLRKGDKLPFGELLPKESIARHLSDQAVRERVFTPAMTIFAFLSQVMSEDQSCQQAVSQVIAHFAREERKMPSSNTAAYCKARARLPEECLSGLAKETAQGLEKAVEPAMLWRNRHIRLPDGTTVSMPDTAANQAVWPQSRTQKKELVFQ